MNSVFYFSYFDPDYPTFGLTVTGLLRVTVPSVPRAQKVEDHKSRRETEFRNSLILSVYSTDSFLLCMTCLMKPKYGNAV
jgi:hypothetical protein